MSHKIALVGNPNTGKTSVFNQLTGLWQRTGNFPGVTVERKKGTISLANATFDIIDLPGTYSLYPISLDERVVVDILSNPQHNDFPDAIIYIADVGNLERSLLLLTQIIDLRIPCMLALNMCDSATKKGITWNRKLLQETLQIPVVEINGRSKESIASITEQLPALLTQKSPDIFYNFTSEEQQIVEKVKTIFPHISDYTALITAQNAATLSHLSSDEQKQLTQIIAEEKSKPLRLQVEETMARYEKISPLVAKSISHKKEGKKSISEQIDQIVTHPILGPIIFFGLMFFIFQAIFSLATIPMDWIDQAFAQFSNFVKTNFKDHWARNLIADGMIPGIGGVVIFIPQIAILFFFITLLEDIGYMARAVFLFDKIMQKFGLSGRSIVALISGGACAIPAIMSTRTISNSKERLITILVTPLISCSARIPVFAILIGFAIPSFTIAGIFNSQGLALFILYLLGATAALLAAFVFKKILHTKEPSYLLLELPTYQPPHWKSIVYTMFQKSKAFVLNAGKIILLISIILWFLASFGPGNKIEEATQNALHFAQENALNEDETNMLINDYRLENSYAGHLGKFIEPAIAPLGYDWKIGIAIITSFAAREVFVGTLATLYSVHQEDENTLKEKMQTSINRRTGAPTFTMASSLSLLIFYLFAMQCVSTLAVTRKETGSWKWPLVQLFYMTSLAYLLAFITYHVLK